MKKIRIEVVFYDNLIAVAMQENERRVREYYSDLERAVERIESYLKKRCKSHGTRGV